MCGRPVRLFGRVRRVSVRDLDCGPRVHGPVWVDWRGVVFDSGRWVEMGYDVEGVRGRTAGRRASRCSVRWPLRVNSGRGRYDRGTIIGKVPLGSCFLGWGCCRHSPNGGVLVVGSRRDRGIAHIGGGR